MSDIFWILFIILLYLFLIRPLFQGATNARRDNPSSTQSPPKENQNTSKKEQQENGDYIDYEEL